MIPVGAQEFAIFPSKSAQVVLLQAQGRLTPSLSNGIVALFVNNTGDFAVELFGYIIAVEANGEAQLLNPAAVIQLATTVQDILNFSTGSFPDFVAQVIERLIAELVFFDKINSVQIGIFFVLKRGGLLHFAAQSGQFFLLQAKLAVTDFGFFPTQVRRVFIDQGFNIGQGFPFFLKSAAIGDVIEQFGVTICV